MNPRPINIIVAFSYPDYIIGDRNTNKMLWHIPEDLKRFRQLTETNIVIMGHNTFKSLPSGPLKNRINIVLSNSQPDSHTKINDSTHLYFTTTKNINNILDFYPTKSIFVIGGEHIYNLYLNTSTIIYATLVHNYVPDYDNHNYAFFPKKLELPDIPHAQPYTFVTLNPG